MRGARLALAEVGVWRDRIMSRGDLMAAMVIGWSAGEGRGDGVYAKAPLCFVLIFLKLLRWYMALVISMA